MGSFLIMGVIGLILASLVNIFLARPRCSSRISVIGVLIFAGLTAYDTQKLKEMYDYGNCDGEAAGQGLDHRRPDALSRLHQHVPVPAALWSATATRAGLDRTRIEAPACGAGAFFLSTAAPASPYRAARMTV